jgi:hypothetical protein
MLPIVMVRMERITRTGLQSLLWKFQKIMSSTRDQDRETERFGRDGEERGDRRRRAFINVRRPHMERRHGDLETQSDKKEKHGRDRQGFEGGIKKGVPDGRKFQRPAAP